INPWEAQFPHCRNIRRRTEPFVTCNRQDIQLIVFKSATSEIARHSCKSHTSFIKISHMFSGALIRRSEEHTSELQSLMRISYAVFCLKKKKSKKYLKFD